jgi:hypothetical protein
VDTGPTPHTTPFDGTWVSPGYRSGHVHATIACITLALASGSVFVIAILTLGVIGLSGDAAQGSFAIAGAGGYAEVVAAWSLVNGVTVLLAGAAFLAWQSRSVANVPSLGGGTPRISPGWSIAWWLVPFANMFMPYRSMADLERRTAAGAPRSRLLGTWWVMFIACNVADGLLSFAMTDTTSIDDARALIAVDVIALLGLATSGILGIVVVRGIQRASEARAAALGLPDGVPLGGPAWGSQPRVLAAGHATPAEATPDEAAPGPPTDGAGSPTRPGSIPVRPDLLHCPSCGRLRASAFRYCVACRFDFTRAG